MAVAQHALQKTMNVTADFEYDVVENSVLLNMQSHCPNEALDDWQFYARAAPYGPVDCLLADPQRIESPYNKD